MAKAAIEGEISWSACSRLSLQILNYIVMVQMVYEGLEEADLHSVKASLLYCLYLCLKNTRIVPHPSLLFSFLFLFLSLHSLFFPFLFLIPLFIIRSTTINQVPIYPTFLSPNRCCSSPCPPTQLRFGLRFLFPDEFSHDSID